MNTIQGNSVLGLMFRIDGEIVQLTKYKNNWYEMFDEHHIDKKHKTRENFETFCYMRYMGMDAEATFIEKICKIEKNNCVKKC